MSTAEGNMGIPRLLFPVVLSVAGYALKGTGKHQQALDAFQKSKALGATPAAVGYNVAALRALMGKPAEAIEQLAEIVKLGFSQPDQLTADPDFQPIRNHPRFAALVEQAKRNHSPCSYDPENRQFDFWIGDWDAVTTRDNVPAGISHIERTIGDCVIWENWTSLGATGFSGKSYNIYNANLKRWEQFWVDNTGAVMYFYGGLQDGVMDYYTDDIPQPGGSKLRRHLQFFNLGPDKVRQFSQTSADAGASWTVEYDFTYNRKK